MFRRASKRRGEREAAELEALLDDDQVEWLTPRPAPVPPRLTVELVPLTCWFSNVRSEVASADWTRIRQHVYERAGYRCEICGGHSRNPRLHCHEIWAYDDGHHIQRLEGMIALCPYCHEVKHIGNANVRGRGEHARAWLAQINQWNEHQLDLYLAYVFEVWEERSLHDWELEIVELAAYGIAVGTLPADLPAGAVRFEAHAEPPAIAKRSPTPSSAS